MNPLRFSLSALLLLGFACGCFNRGTDEGVINRAVAGSLPDQDNDGLGEISPPPHVPFEPESTLGANIRSTITFEQATSLVRMDIPDYAAEWVSVEVTILLTYEDGTTQTLKGVLPVAPFEVHAEIACVVSLEASAIVVADVPFSGRQTVATYGPILVDDRDLDLDAACGSMLDMVVSLNDRTGQVQSVVTIR